MSFLMNFPWQWNWFQHWYWITCLWHFHFLEKVSVFNDFSQSIVMNRQVHFSEEYIFLAVHFFQGYIFPVVEHGSTFPGKWVCLECFSQVLNIDKLPQFAVVSLFVCSKRRSVMASPPNCNSLEP